MACKPTYLEPRGRADSDRRCGHCGGAGSPEQHAACPSFPRIKSMCTGVQCCPGMVNASEGSCRGSCCCLTHFLLAHASSFFSIIPGLNSSSCCSTFGWVLTEQGNGALRIWQDEADWCSVDEPAGWNGSPCNLVSYNKHKLTACALKY